MSVLAIAFALLLAQDVEAAPPAAPAAEAEMPYPVGAPREDYQLVSWCYGSLRGYLDLHDQVMPEVRRIETTFRRPGSNLAEDLKVYADLQKEGQGNLKLFSRAMTAAEKASLKPINVLGGEAVKKGRATWAAAASVPKARLAQEWMSWALPVRCVPTAEALEKRALLSGSAFQVNAEQEAAAEPAPEPAPAPEAPAPEPTIDSVLEAAPPSSEPDAAAAPVQTDTVPAA
jgi:hypothetical protein